MTRRVGIVICGWLWLGPALAQAQVVTGSAQVDAVSAGTSTQGTSSHDGMVGQSYALNWSSSLFDPRLIQYDLGASYSTISQSALRSQQADQQGRNGNLGYQFGTQLLAASPFPLSIRVSRARTSSVGDVGTMNPIRNGALSATGAPPSDFESINHDLLLNWHLGLEWLPKVDLSYRRNSSDMSGGNYTATQQGHDFSASVTQASPKTRQTLRYQSTASENRLDQVYGQRFGTLDYDFAAMLSKRSRLNLTAGRRSAYSHVLFQVPPTSGGAYEPPVDIGGENAGVYTQANYQYEPGARFRLRASATLDAQAGATATTSSDLAGVSAQYEAFKGLQLTAGVTSGRRQQIILERLTSVLTSTADAGAAYQGTRRWFGYGASVSGGTGTGTNSEGVRGGSRSLSGDAHVSSTVRWFSASAGVGRSTYDDDLLEFGNFDSRQVHVSAQAEGRRGVLSLNADRTHVERGLALVRSQNQLGSYSATAGWHIGMRHNLSATFGHFRNEVEQAQLSGTDSNLFWAVGADSIVTPTFHVMGWVRRENAATTITRYNQDAVSALARADYRLRTLKFSLEYRKSRSLTSYPGLTNAYTFAGHQVRFSVARQFGMRVP